MSEGEFEKCSLTKDDVESLIMTYWSERFIPLSDIDKARKEFPEKQTICDMCVDGKSYIAYSSDKIDKWLLKWFGDDKK